MTTKDHPANTIGNEYSVYFTKSYGYIIISLKCQLFNLLQSSTLLGEVFVHICKINIIDWLRNGVS